MADVHAAIYIRVSTADQANEGLSLAAQVAACQDYLRYRQQPLPACLYADQGISGGSVAKRPAMTQLLADIAAGRIQLVVATKLDRLFRNVRDAAESLERMKAAGCGLALLDLQVDTSTAAGGMVMNMMASFAQFERQQAGERTLAVNRRIAAEGRWLGPNAPFGYRYDRDTKRLEVDEEKAAVVREIYRLYVQEGWGRGRIVNSLMAQGIPAPMGEEWSESCLAYLLRNPVYAGEIEYGKPHDGNRRRGDWSRVIRATGQHEAIIDAATYQAAQVRDARQGPGRPASPRHLLAGLLVCEQCGSPLYARPVAGTHRAYYVCGRRIAYHAAACPGAPWVRTTHLEETVIRALDANIRRIHPERFAASKSGRPSDRGRQKKREYWTGRRERAQRLYLDGDLSEERYAEERAAAEAALAELDAPTVPSEPPPIPPMTFAEIMGDPDLPIESKRRALSPFIERIVVGGEMVTIHYAPWHRSGWREVETLPLPRTDYQRTGRGRRR